MSTELLVEAAETLRTARFVLDRLQTALVAFGDPKWGAGLDSEFERAKGALTLIDETLGKLPPEEPLTPEEEARVAQVVAAALNKRFGDGTGAELDEAMDDWLRS